MTKKSLEKVKLIEKFLDLNSVNLNAIKTIDDVGKLSVSSFNFLSEKDGENIKDLFNISKIDGLKKLDLENPFKKMLRSKNKKVKLLKIKSTDTEFEEKIKKAITISLIIQKIKHESRARKKKDQKVLVLGLNNAGKTAILSKFGGQLGIKELASLKPTRGVSRKEIKTRDLNLHLWDFGGQKDHREEYFQTPETYFFRVDLIIYVIDVQDTQRFEESIDYFEKIIDALIELEESPQILIFLHKFDPDIRNENEVLLNVELLKDLIKGIFQNKNINYDIYLSSIFSMISNEPEFSKFIKQMMNNSADLTDPTSLKISELGNIIESALNAVVQLSSTVMVLEKRIETLETPKRGRPSKSKSQKPLPNPEYSKVAHPPIPPPPQILNPKGKRPSHIGAPNLRVTLMGELREMFVKKGISQ